MGQSTARTQQCAVGTTVVWTGHNFLDSILAIPDGVNAMTVTVYDGITATGRILAVVQTVATSALTVLQNYNHALSSDIGLTVVVAGGTGSAIIAFGAT